MKDFKRILGIAIFFEIIFYIYLWMNPLKNAITLVYVRNIIKITGICYIVALFIYIYEKDKNQKK